jgi:DNA-binding PadR family transcriptional regulator
MTKSEPNMDEILPLTPIVFHILLALTDGEKHGYGIMQTVAADTDGKVRIPIGSLYGAIQRMQALGLIEETDERPAPELDDERRRHYYRLTGVGQQALKAEVRRLANAVTMAKRKRIFAEFQLRYLG